MNNDRIQEFFLVIGDRLAPVGKKWWYALLFTLIALVPFYYAVKYAFVQNRLSRFQNSHIIYTSAIKQPLQIIDKKIFSLSNNTYSGYVRIKNINLDWGVAEQPYTVEFKTLGGTGLNKINGKTFILPSSEKLIVFSRFTSQQQPDELVVSLDETKFVHKPDIFISLEKERISLQNNSDGVVVSGGVKNLTAFTIKQVDLPVVVYNSKNEIVAVNSTFINDLQSGEIRTFQYTWSKLIDGAIRAEINPEVNIFDRNVFSSQPGVSPFNNQ